MLKRLVPLLFVILTALYITKGMWLPHEKEVQVNVGSGYQVPVSVAIARAGNLQEGLQLPVDIKAESQVNVIPTFLGRIEIFYVKEGDTVTKGDKLLKYVGPAENEEGFFDDLIVRSPISGVVTAVLKDAGMNAEKDAPLLTISSIDTVRGVVNLPSEYKNTLASGMQASLRLDALPGKVITGRLKSVRPQVDPVSRTSYVEFLIDNSEHSVQPGMAGMITFSPSGSGQAGIVVPMVSIFVENDRSYVYLNAGNKAVKRAIRVVQEGVEQAVVQGDISAGAAVLTTRPDSLKDGDPIYVVK